MNATHDAPTPVRTYPGYLTWAQSTHQWQLLAEHYARSGDAGLRRIAAETMRALERRRSPQQRPCDGFLASE